MIKKKFRYDISFLRFLAVVFVVLFHFKVPFFDGGFIGVDIFFVISGFLMTFIILSGIKDQKFKIIEFYKRRVERIIPAMLFLIIVLSFFSFFILKEDMKSLFRYAISSEGFFSNIFYLRNSGYFDNSSQNNPLLHTWSLSVEWQFYIIYPLILLATRKIYRNGRLKFIALFFSLTAVSFLLMLYYIHRDSSLNFYSLSTRAWEMMLGGTVFLMNSNFKNYDFRIGRNSLIFLCFGTLALSVLFIDETMVWPSAITLLPVLATAVLLYLETDFSFYKMKVFSFIGDISYSLYLWHWPFFVFFQYFGVKYNYLTIFVLITCSVLCASFSYYYIEINKKVKNVPLILVVLGVLAVFHLFFIKMGADMFMNHTEPKFTNNLSWELETRQNLGCNLGQSGKDKYSISECLTTDKNLPNVLLIGDSHAGALAFSLNDAFAKKGVNMLQMTYSGSAPLYHSQHEVGQYNNLSNYLFNDFIPKYKKHINLVVISLYYSESMYIPKYRNILFNLNQTIIRLERLGIPVLVVGENETYKLNYEKIRKLKSLYPKIIEKNYLDSSREEINIFLKNKYGERYVNIYGNLSKASGDELYMFDTNHFTKFGADQVVSLIMKTRQVKDVVN